jgi:hypothetical protein
MGTGIMPRKMTLRLYPGSRISAPSVIATGSSNKDHTNTIEMSPETSSCNDAFYAALSTGA